MFDVEKEVTSDLTAANLQQDMCIIWTNLSSATDTGLLDSYSQLLGGVVDCNHLYIKGSDHLTFRIFVIWPWFQKKSVKSW